MLRAFIAGGIIVIISAIYPIGEAFPQEWSWYLNYDFLNPTGVNADGYNSAYLHDIDLDDDLDLVVGQGDGTIQLYYNDGFPDVERWRLDDTYFAELSFDYAVVPSLGDFDGDDSLELVVSFTQWQDPVDSLRAFRNRGSPGDPHWVELTGFFNISTIECTDQRFVDWDNDNDFDLIVRHQSFEGEYLFYRNAGTPGNPVWELDEFITDAFPSAEMLVSFEGLDIADFNGDGYHDILRSYLSFEEVSIIELLINEGTNEDPIYPSWGIGIGEYSEDNSNSISVGDMDDDGDFDLMCGNETPLIRYYPNSGDGVSPEFHSIDMQEIGPFFIDLGEDLALLDRDNDGDLDMAAICSFWLLPIGRQILLWATFDNEGNSFMADFQSTTWFSWNETDYTDLAVTAGDINRDAWEDLIFSIHGTLYTLRNVAGYEFEFDESFFWNFDHFVKHPELVDLDSDDDLDLLVIDLSSNELTAFMNLESVMWSHKPEWVENLDLSATFARAVNLNGDNLPDLVLEVDDRLQGYLNVGDNDDPSFLYVPEIFQDWQDLDIGYFNIADLDGDSDDDIILDNSGVILFLENQTPLSTDEIRPLPENAFILFNYPNPFNSSTTISFTLPEAGRVSLNVYDITGRLVNSLIDADVDAGRQTVIWAGTGQSGRPVSSGIYFCALRLGEISSSRRMLLLR